jgi:hypothetical protein
MMHWTSVLRWERYLTALRTEHLLLRALKEEMIAAKLIA